MRKNPQKSGKKCLKSCKNEKKCDLLACGASKSTAQTQKAQYRLELKALSWHWAFDQPLFG